MTNTLDRGGLEPAWNKVFKLAVNRESEQDALRFTIMNKDNEFGTATLRLSSLVDKLGQKQWVIDVRGGAESKKLGEMMVETKHVPVVAVNPNNLVKQLPTAVSKKASTKSPQQFHGLQDEGDKDDEQSRQQKFYIDSNSQVNLEIKVCRGKFIRDTEAIGEMDPFAVLEYEGH